MGRPIDELGGIPGLPGHVRNVLLDHEGRLAKIEKYLPLLAEIEAMKREHEEMVDELRLARERVPFPEPLKPEDEVKP